MASCRLETGMTEIQNCYSCRWKQSKTLGGSEWFTSYGPTWNRSDLAMVIHALITDYCNMVYVGLPWKTGPNDQEPCNLKDHVQPAESMKFAPKAMISDPPLMERSQAGLKDIPFQWLIQSLGAPSLQGS